jgi:hypothetical protein
MGHLLATVNPEAARQIDDRRPLPRIGQPVVYHPRPSEIRRGRTEIPAIVLAVDEHNRRLELMVMFEAADMITQPSVPEHVAGDRGWSYLPDQVTDEIAALREENAQLRNKLDVLTAMVCGDFQMPEGESVLSLLDIQDGRVTALEGKVDAILLPNNDKLQKMNDEMQRAKRQSEEETHQPKRRLRGNRA